MTEQEVRDLLSRERSRTRAAAKAFADACASGDADQFFAAVDLLNEATDGWRLGMMRAARLHAVSAEIRDAFLPVWIESKMLSLQVGDRRVLANALRVLMPCAYRGDAIRLYRGAGWHERRRRLYGFSWTRHQEIARDKFAAHWRTLAPGGVVLATLAPAAAVLLVRDDEDYYDEGEIVVDPFALGPVTVVDRLLP